MAVDAELRGLFAIYEQEARCIYDAIRQGPLGAHQGLCEGAPQLPVPSFFKAFDGKTTQHLCQDSRDGYCGPRQHVDILITNDELRQIGVAKGEAYCR